MLAGGVDAQTRSSQKLNHRAILFLRLGGEHESVPAVLTEGRDVGAAVLEQEHDVRAAGQRSSVDRTITCV